MTDAWNRRPDPEGLLRSLEEEERAGRRGRLKVFLGYASGVGKTLRMFREGARRRKRGEDVVVAAVQPANSPEAEEELRRMEVIPLRGQGIDMDTVLKRRPGVCLVDGLAYGNPAGSRNAERWQDVEELLEAGISVVTSLNIQYVAEKQAKVEAIRGRRVAEAVPERFLERADEIEVVDAPAEACRESGAGVDAEGLAELRSMALRLAADVVDRQLEEYLRRHGIEQSYGTQERILVCMTARSNAALMLRRAGRQAERFQGELHAITVRRAELDERDQETLDRNLAAAREAGARVAVVEGHDVVAAILEYARRRGITQIFAGHSGQRGWLRWWRANPLERLILGARGFDVRIFPQEAGPDG